MADSKLGYSPELEKELEAFVNAKEGERTWKPEIEKILENIAITGVTCFPWQQLQTVLLFQFKRIFSSFQEQNNNNTTLQEHSNQILSDLEYYTNAPFTIQRLCELALKPNSYKQPEKYLFAVKRLVTVSTTQNHLTPTEYNATVSSLAQQRQDIEKLNQPTDMEISGSNENNSSEISTSMPTTPRPVEEEESNKSNQGAEQQHNAEMEVEAETHS